MIHSMIHTATKTSLALLALGSLASAAPVDGHLVALRATRVHTGDGTVHENGIVMIRDGKIVEVGREVAVSKEIPLVELEGDLSPGLVVLRDHSGAASEDRDETRTVCDTMDLAHAFDADHSEVHALTHEGITTFVLAPSAGNLVGGLAAAVKPGAGVLARQVFLHVDMSSSALAFNRFPTSYAGAVMELERLFDAGEGVFGKATSGQQNVMLHAGTRAELLRACSFAGKYGLKGSLLVGSRVGEVVETVKASGMGVILPPIPIGADTRDDVSATRLSEAGVPIAFGLDARSNGPAALRFTVAAARRAGLSRDAAMKALTSDAARLAGVDGRVGTLQAGRDADIVLWSGHPADATSRVITVWIDGEQVHHDSTASDEDGGDQ